MSHYLIFFQVTDIYFHVLVFLQNGEQREPRFTASSPVRLRAHINVHHRKHGGKFTSVKDGDGHVKRSVFLFNNGIFGIEICATKSDS